MYTYRSHGIHVCANVVCGDDGVAGAVLLRAAAVESGLDIAQGPSRATLFALPASREVRAICARPWESRWTTTGLTCSTLAARFG